MLRHYDDIGLLKPAETDGFTGYRYYREDQLFTIARITALMLVVILVTNGLGGCALDKTGMVRTSNNLMEGMK